MSETSGGLTRLVPGTTFAGAYRVEAALAEGGMGAVYRVEQVSNGKRRALKVLHPELVASPRIRAHFAQEARIGARIQSDHVVEVTDAGIDAATGMPWLAMEFLEGDALDKAIEGGRHLPPAEVARIFEQMGHALGAAHDTGVLHLDLKPENIFLARVRLHGASATVVKVLDFGIARVLAEDRTSTAVTTAIGSPYWMAPEQATSDGEIRRATDVWALGLIAFRLLTGVSYWAAANAVTPKLRAVLTDIMFNPLVPASQRATELKAGDRLPPGFDAWFARCVNRDARQRFPDAGEAVTALLAVLAPRTSVPPTVMLDQTPKSPFVGTVMLDRPPTAPRLDDPDPSRGTFAIPPTTMQDSAVGLALDALNRALAIDPGSAETWAARGACHLRLGRPVEALRDYSAAIERTPGAGDHWYGRSRVHLALGNPTQARGDLVQAASLGHDGARRELVG